MYDIYDGEKINDIFVTLINLWSVKSDPCPVLTSKNNCCSTYL